MKQVKQFALSVAICAALAAQGAGYSANGRWSNTASGTVGPLGTPVTLTWSFVADDTTILDLGGGSHQSDLISTLDASFGGPDPGGDPDDFTLRPWFARFEECFDRWEQLGGVTFVYQAADDGVNHGTLQGNSSRGDIRFGGTSLGGVGGTYGSSYFIPNADITLDTTDFGVGGHFTTASSNYRGFRNTVSHEIGHAIGLGHVLPNAGNFLMEANYSAAYDGPQFDDIRGLQFQYGDAIEKSNGGLGNGTPSNATNLGTIASGTEVIVGADGTTGIRVETSEDDFVSISNSNDFDYYSFVINAPSRVDFNLSPVGPTFNQKIGSGATFLINSMSISNLNLQVYSVVEGSPVLLASVDGNPMGMGEVLSDFEIAQAGEYFVRVAGSANDVQLYRLAISAETFVPSQPGDFDHDGDVDGVDFLLWQRGHSPSPLSTADLSAWQENYGIGGISAIAAVPEPATVVTLTLAFGVIPIFRHAKARLV